MLSTFIYGAKIWGADLKTFQWKVFEKGMKMHMISHVKVRCLITIIFCWPILSITLLNTPMLSVGPQGYSKRMLKKAGDSTFRASHCYIMRALRTNNGLSNVMKNLP